MLRNEKSDVMRGGCLRCPRIPPSPPQNLDLPILHLGSLYLTAYAQMLIGLEKSSDRIVLGRDRWDLNVMLARAPQDPSDLGISSSRINASF